MDNSEINLDYYSLLTPPEGYSLGKAIGTTYSLDLRTALSIPLAFHFKNGIDPELMTDPFALFLSLKGTAEKIDIFCQLGGISSNVNDNKLFRFIEKSINEISLDNGKSFHPKVWIIRFERDGYPSIYKIINLSRNLTNDCSWDMVVAFEGEVREQGTAIDSKTNRPLIDFVTYLYNKTKNTVPNNFLSDLDKVCFRPLKEMGSDFKLIEFLPLGIGDQFIDIVHSEFPDQKYEHTIIVSPFVSQGILDTISGNSAKLTLISRLNSLEELDQKKLESINCFTINERIVSGGSGILSEDSDNPKESNTEKGLPVFDLHAKVYFVKQGMEYYMMLGSANASYNAFNGNIEFLIRLLGERRNSAEYFLETYFKPSNDFLVKYEPDPSRQKNPDNSREKILDKLHADICIQLSNTKCTCIEDGENTYMINIIFDAATVNSEEFELYLRPLSVSETFQKKLNSSVEFSKINIKDLSTLFVLTIIDTQSKLVKSAIIKLNIENMPSIREEAVVRSLISNKKDLFRLLRLLLSEDLIDALLDGGNDDSLGGVKSKWNYALDDEYAIFEKMMVASSRNPTKLKEVKTIIDYLEDNSSTKGIEDNDIKEFVLFWNNFKETLKN